jgi:hypothetical protein
MPHSLKVCSTTERIQAVLFRGAQKVSGSSLVMLEFPLHQLLVRIFLELDFWDCAAELSEYAPNAR